MNKVNTVYILSQGEDNEGASIIGVFSTFELAEKSFYKHIEDDKCLWGTVSTDLDDMNKLYAHNDGCDFLSVTEYTVDSYV